MGQAPGPISAKITRKPRHVFVGEGFHTFQLDHEHVFDEEIGKVFSDSVAL